MEKVINDADTSAWFMQETKCTKVKKLKLKGFAVYEKVRKYVKKGDKKQVRRGCYSSKART